MKALTELYWDEDLVDTNGWDNEVLANCSISMFIACANLVDPIYC